MYFTHRKSQYGEPPSFPFPTPHPSICPSHISIDLPSLLCTDLKLQTLNEEKRQVVSFTCIAESSNGHDSLEPGIFSDIFTTLAADSSCLTLSGLVRVV